MSHFGFGWILGGPFVVSCEHDSEIVGWIKGREFLVQ